MSSSATPDSKSDSLLLPLGLLACAAGLGGVAAVMVSVVGGYARSRGEATAIHLPTPQERMAEPGMVSRGAAVFGAQCASCHGKMLEGMTGPCLTDAVWLKGSTFADLLKSINEGSVEKGMTPFEKVLSEDEKIAVIAFIKSRAQGFRGVKYAVYDGNWKTMPDFASLKPADEGVLKDDEPVALHKFERSVNYGAVFSGKLLVPETGDYAFQLSSDDGSQFLVDGQMVVDNDGLHNDKERKSATAALKAGEHAFELRYFQGGADHTLRLSWTGPSSAGFLTEAVATPEQLMVKDRVRVVRGNIKGQVGPRMLTVGLPGAANVAFDTDSFALPFAWRGEFLDVGGSRVNRGTLPNQPLESKTAAQTSKPLVHAGGAVPEFLGYRPEGGKLVVEGRLQGARFDLTLEPSAKGAKATVLFRDKAPAGAVVEDAAGARPLGEGPQVLEFAF